MHDTKYSGRGKDFCPGVYIEISLIGDSWTHAMKKKMLHLSNKLRLDINIQFYSTSPPAIQTFFKSKDPIVKHMQSDVVYSVQYIDFRQTYVGRAEGQYMRRIREHGTSQDVLNNLNG